MKLATSRAFPSTQGLVRLCATPYALPTDENLCNAQMHLTNYAVNKVRGIGVPNVKCI